jgi:hypothetical protein
MAVNEAHVRERRDNKVRLMMADRAPIWLEKDEFRPHEEGLVFNLIYANTVDGWVSERYKYDGYNDVLYHMGTRILSEEETLSYEQTPPYIDGAVATRVPMDPAQRLTPPLRTMPGKQGK